MQLRIILQPEMVTTQWSTYPIIRIYIFIQYYTHVRVKSRVLDTCTHPPLFLWYFKLGEECWKSNISDE